MMELRKFKIIIGLLAGVVIMSASSVSSYAWEHGHVTISPSFMVSEVWDSNIFYDPSNEKDDFITLLTPGISSEFAFGQAGRHKASVEYDAELGIFSRFDKQNYGNHTLKNDVNLDLGDYSLDLSNNFQFTSSRTGTEFERRNLRKEDSAAAVLGFHYNKLDFDLRYKYYIVDYLSDTLKTLNRYENEVGLTGYMKVMTKTRALLEFNYKNLQYPDVGQRNGNAYAVLTGLQGDLTAKLTGTVKAGFQVKKYESSPRDDFNSAVASISLGYDLNDRTDIGFSYQREAYESTFSNNNFYTGDHFDTLISYKWRENVIAKLDGMYYHNAYPEPGTGDAKKRTDDEWAVGIGVDYIWKEWLTAGIGYKFHQRASNLSSREYDQHVISGNVTLVF